MLRGSELVSRAELAAAVITANDFLRSARVSASEWCCELTSRSKVICALNAATITNARPLSFVWGREACPKIEGCDQEVGN